MKRNLRYGTGKRFTPQDPVAAIAPPVFKTPLDAWHHLVRHPDDYLMYEDVPDDLDPQFAFGAPMDDFADRMFGAQDFVLARINARRQPDASDASNAGTDGNDGGDAGGAAHEEERSDDKEADPERADGVR